MGQINIPGTSIQYSNPNQLDATAIDPKTGAPWVQWPTASGTTTRWGGSLTYPGPATPQPGSYNATPPTANPVSFNAVAPAPLPIITTKNPDGSTKSANGLVPNSSVVFRNPS
jgi:hypothetical protein